MIKRRIDLISTTIICIFLFLLSGCENKDEISTGSGSLLNVSSIVRLANDSTQMAGALAIPYSGLKVDLKWNVPECNIDTSQTTAFAENGICKIPIKWLQRDSTGNYAPKSKAFDGGLMISDGNISKYVHLIWADKIDSVKIMQESNVTTRSGEALPRAVVLEVTPLTLNMDKVVGGAVYVEFSGIAGVLVDQNYISESTNIVKDSIPVFLSTPRLIHLKWIDGIAPADNFSTQLRFMAGNIMKTTYINYTVPVEPPLIWTLISSNPANGSTLPSTYTEVSVQVRTNRRWSVESSVSEDSPVIDTTTGIGDKTLTIHISANTTGAARSVTVLVKSQNELKETLSFIQPAVNEGDVGTSFQFVSANPANNATIPASGTTATIKVNTDYAWWINLNGVKTSYPAGALGEKTGTLAIPANPTADNRIVTFTVGHGETTVQTINYIQLGTNGGGTGTAFQFISADPANNATIASGGVTATVKVNTDYAWWINYNGTKTTYTAGALGEKTGTLAIPANPTTANRIVTYTVGYDETTVETINYIQSGDGTDNTLEYQSSTLPTGNIPQSGGTYTFTFTGTYTGGVQVRALANGTVIATGTEVTNKQPSVAVTNNTLTTTRNITFQYKRADGDWVALPASTNRVQDGTGGGGGDDTFAIGPILPTGDVPELGKTYYCTFSGKGADAVIFRAFRNGREVARSGEGVVTPGSVTYGVAVPELEPDPNSYVYFEYSTNNGATWIDMNDRRWQKHDWIVVNTESISLYPAKNAGCRFYVSGTAQREVVMLAFVDGVQVNRVTCYPTPEQQVIFVSIPDNPGPNRRNVSFSWSYDNTIWSSTSLRPQAAP